MVLLLMGGSVCRRVLLLSSLCLWLPRPAAAHVRMPGRLQKFGAVPLPIRNANAVGADGAASVGGPCGGSAYQYKEATAPDVLDGGVVQLSLEYAAGHESEANLFTATMACGAPSQTELRSDNAKATVLTAQQCRVTQGGSTYPVPAKTGRDAKVLECTLPRVNNLGGNKGHCSLSVQDQRFWGGCVDVKLVDAATMAANKQAAAVAPPAPPEKPFVSEQTVTNIVTSGPPPKLPCCGLTYAHLGITKGDTADGTTSAILVTGYAFGLFCDAGLNFAGNRVDLTLDGETELTEDKPLRLVGAPGEQSFESEASSEIKINQIPARISYTSGYLSVTMLGDSAINPTVCDSGISFAAKPEFGAPCRDGGRCADELKSSSASRFRPAAAVLAVLAAVVGFFGAAVCFFEL
jgi:hypothetical protein